MRKLLHNPISYFHPDHGAPEGAAGRLTRFHALAAERVFTFYLISAVYAYGKLASLHLNERTLQPAYLWPVAWIEGLGVASAPQYLGIAFFLTALGCALKNGSRILRIAFAVQLWMIAALLVSYGSISHGNHIWIWIAVFLAFAPTDLSANASRKQKLGLLAAFTGAQFYILLTYSMAGLNKIRGGVAAIQNGDAGNFSFTGFANQIADRSVQAQTEPVFAEFVINNPHLSGPLFWFVILAQFLAVFVIFFPRFHRSFGFTMIAFHFGTWALMEITFPMHVLWLLMFFVFSPFRPENVDDSPIAIMRDALIWVRKRAAARIAPATPVAAE